MTVEDRSEKDQRLLFLVDVHAEISQARTALQAVDDGSGIDDGAAGPY